MLFLAVEMAQSVNHLLYKCEDPSLVPRGQAKVEVENRLHEVVLWHSHMACMSPTHTHTWAGQEDGVKCEALYGELLDYKMRPNIKNDDTLKL